MMSGTYECMKSAHIMSKLCVCGVLLHLVSLQNLVKASEQGQLEALRHTWGASKNIDSMGKQKWT